MVYLFTPFLCRGSFELLMNGNELASFDGVQAHLSMSASPKVLEVATKFPSRVRLEEISWIRSWPSQFQVVNPDENNIALFFFAKDIERFACYTYLFIYY